MKRALSAALLLVAVLGPARAQLDEIERTATELRDRALEDDLAYRLLESLTVEVGHRLAGSAGDKAAVAWAQRELSKLGFDRVWTEPVTVPHWVRGEAVGRILEPYPHDTVLLALGGSVGTPDGGITAEVIGVRSLEELEQLPERRVRDKIVFVNRPTERTRTGRGYGEAGAVRRSGPSAAAAKGAVALLIRSIGTGNQRFAHTGSTRYRDDVSRIPAAALAIPDAEILWAQLARGESVRFHLELGSHYRPNAQSANVIAEIRGREAPEEIVLLGAHLDSWDVGTGAHDDGAGCAIVTAAGHLIAGLPDAPRRTVRVVLFANEEFGLSGAFAYAKEHADELPRHQLAIESDLGGDAVWAFATAVRSEIVPEAERIASLLTPLGIEWAGNVARGGADLIPLRAARVPRADLRQDATRYFDLHHTIDDTFDKIDPAMLAQNVAAYATIGYWAAETPSAFAPAPEAAAPTGASVSVGALELRGLATVPWNLKVAETPVGGLSGIAYDALLDRYYVLSDDPSARSPARFYTVRIDLANDRLAADGVSIEGVTTVTDLDGRPIEKLVLDGEGIALTPDRNLLISSEGNIRNGVPPSIRLASLSGRTLREYELPGRYLAKEGERRGVRHNAAFESITVAPEGGAFFTATENALLQDDEEPAVGRSTRARIARLDLESGATEAEYVYVLDPVVAAPASETDLRTNGLVDLLALGGDSFLALERSFTLGVGNSIRIFLVSTAGADDVRHLLSLAGREPAPVTKRLLLDLADLDLTPDNIEAMTFGPRLRDGRRSLILVSDDNFNLLQTTQFILFAVDG